MKRWAVLLLLLASACKGPAPPAADGIELVYASPYSPTHPFSLADQDWMAWVESQSGGRIQIRPIWSGALISSDQSMIELRHGVADIGLVTPIYAKGGAHLLRNQTGFYSGVVTQEDQIALFRCLQRTAPAIGDELQGLKVLAVQGGNPPGILTRNTPIETLSDLEGLRLRAPTELLPVLDALGAEPVSMPMGEVYSALAKGILDGVVAPEDTFRSLHFAEVAGYFAHLAIPRGAYPGRAMGIDKWNSLPPDVQEILDRAIPEWERALIRRTSEAIAEGSQFGREQGLKETVLSAADQARFQEIYSRHAEEIAQQLSHFGIDGMAVYRTARASIAADGTVHCKENH